MYTEEDLEAAVSAGVVTAEAVEALRRYVAEERHTTLEDEEHFRLVSGFNDIFVVIASVLLLLSITWLGVKTTAWLGPLLAGLTAWGLAEFFTRRRRMALPSIVLLIAFVGNVFSFMVCLLPGETKNYAYIAAGLVAGFAAFLHWERFHVPITVAAGLASMALAFLFFIFTTFPFLKNWMSLIFFTAGLVIFSTALSWDASDTKRETGRSDVAFWLHLLAAPFLVHPVFLALDIGGNAVTLFQAGLVVLLYLAISLVSILINRRALMVSSLGYVLYVFANFLKTTGTVELGFATTGFVVGTALLLLSAFWHPCRRLVLRILPESLARAFSS